MMKEIELKFRVDDFSPIRKKLRVLGGKCLWKGKEENWFYDRKDKFLKKSGKLLRIKKMGDVRLTLKANHLRIKGMKVQDEYQTALDRPDEMIKILSHLGFLRMSGYTKYREHWKLKNAWVELDTINKGEKFVEIEGARKQIQSLARIFDLDFKQSTAETYGELIRPRLKY
ncbi:MAG: hypothetical protein A2847_02840 [Candidatus Sungbacteria bacterium RIFCSPHIGHO2_01_FULL_50_25]|uniref:CYTH domain-containing protein n=1 Tax=Candidatus Sungbacteria bacterium RIFCSPHIGHO2_01_FULL_50_25 TaxID=1802265 RepID=A0A1G2KAS4_9BACT|nr:MAG: hypothetical protein A2847_02840 [Candidatus Sungbacteria bacterium RIFCSPHIGHO2_01_FULL_50_25]